MLKCWENKKVFTWRLKEYSVGARWTSLGSSFHSQGATAEKALLLVATAVAPQLWNQLPREVSLAPTLYSFRHQVTRLRPFYSLSILTVYKYNFNFAVSNFYFKFVFLHCCWFYLGCAFILYFISCFYTVCCILRMVLIFVNCSGGFSYWAV